MDRRYAPPPGTRPGPNPRSLTARVAAAGGHEAQAEACRGAAGGAQGAAGQIRHILRQHRPDPRRAGGPVVIVVDASVAAKCYLPERGTEAAVELMTGHNRLTAPELIRLEVLSAITRCVRNGEATASESRAQCQRWLRNLS